MKLRYLILTVGLLGSLFANTVFALGLGEIKLNSSLNEPLDMEIELLNVGDLGELEMLVGLGSRQDFEQAGVERLFLLTDLRFKVDLTTPNKPVIHVTSRKPIREPYLDFLVEILWPTGRLLREYTLLLDLPLYATESLSAKKIEAASQSSQREAQSGNQTQSRPKEAVSPSVGMSSLAAGDGEYKVNSGDTVWGIAKKIKPSDASLQQTMLAIKQYNAHAFINDNINLLKKGAIIRLPEGSDIASLGHNQAVSDIALETAALEDAKVMTAPQLDASDDVVEATSVIQDAGGGQLKLATLDQDQAPALSGVGGNGSGTGGADSNVLQNDVSTVQEELDKTQRENTELKARLANLEEQVATMSRLVEINDDSFRAVQVASQQASELDDSSTPTADNLEQDIAAQPQSSTSEKEEGFNLSAWMDMLLYPLIALLALLLAIVLFFRNRKHDEDESEELSLRSLVDEQEPEPEEEIEEIDDVFSEKELEVLAEVVPEFDEQELKAFEELELAEGEKVNPEGEAEIYLSLGNYQQAETVLINAIDEDPSNTALRLKLLEVHVNANDLKKFDAQSIALAALNDASADAKAVSLRSELTPEPLASEPEQEDADNDDSATGELTADLEKVEDESTSSDVSEEVSHSTEADFDLDLDLADVDIDSLVLEIDADIGDIDFDDAEAQIEVDVQPEDATEELVVESADDFDGGADILEGIDECATKLELAEAYLEMGDIDGARAILDEVVSEGSEAQQNKARELLEAVT